MIVIVVVDDENGMLFNKRRQSRDKILTDRIMEMAKGETLWIKPYSDKLFSYTEELKEDDDCLKKAAPGEYCFIEDASLSSYEREIEKLVRFKWNRIYPHDQCLDIDLENERWKLVYTEDFPGSSHEKITMEVYTHET